MHTFMSKQYISHIIIVKVYTIYTTTWDNIRRHVRRHRGWWWWWWCVSASSLGTPQRYSIQDYYYKHSHAQSTNHHRIVTVILCSMDTKVYRLIGVIWLETLGLRTTHERDVRKQSQTRKKHILFIYIFAGIVLDCLPCASPLWNWNVNGFWSCCRYFVNYRRPDVLYSMMHSAHKIGGDRGIPLKCTSESPPVF